MHTRMHTFVRWLSAERRFVGLLDRDMLRASNAGYDGI
jgi:hypothetical protein